MMNKTANNFVTHAIQNNSVKERLQFAIDFAHADLGSLNKKELNALRRRISEFLGYIEVEHETPLGTQTGRTGTQETAGMDIIFDGRRQPKDYELADFAKLQDKILPIVKGASQSRSNVKMASALFQNVRFSMLGGSLSVIAADLDDAFLVTLFLLLSRWEYAKRIWDCPYCGKPFYKNKRQIYCESCKTRADRDRVKIWRRAKVIQMKVLSLKARGKSLQQIVEKLSLDIKNVSNILNMEKTALEKQSKTERRK